MTVKIGGSNKRMSTWKASASGESRAGAAFTA